MKKVKLMMIALMMCLVGMSYGQITTSKVSDVKEIIDETPYDSLDNFLGKDVHKYIGQELYLNGMSEDLRKYGYDNFLLDYNEKSTSYKNTYKPVVVKKDYIKYDIGGGKTEYDSITGKYFKVISVHKHPKAKESEYLYGTKFFLKLKEKESGDIVYYQYDGKYEHSFPFIVVGYFIKQKEKIGKEFIIRGVSWISLTKPMVDMNTGLPVKFDCGSKWKSIDVTIEEKYYNLSYVLENEIGEKITLSLSNSERTKYVFSVEDAEKYIVKFGKSNFDAILKGVVKVGFTEEMAKLSWGEPKKINHSSSGDQWVYDGQYLYFRNGKLTSFN